MPDGFRDRFTSGVRLDFGVLTTSTGIVVRIRLPIRLAVGHDLA